MHACVARGVSETEQMDTGLLVEVWSKGLLWDKALGYRWLPLNEIQYSNEVSPSIQSGKPCSNALLRCKF